MKTSGALTALVTAALLCSIVATAHAGDNNTHPGTGTGKLVTTKHRITAGSVRLNYTTTAGWLILKRDDGQERSRIFFVAYEKTGGTKKDRPISFAFNGGPGSSSVWLHLGALGPRRVRLNPDGSAPPPPAELVDNEHTWLAFTDLVFIDPVGTGYSRAADVKKEQEFFNFREDIASVGDVIRLYLTRAGRWHSPKYLVGESYGTTRAVGLLDYLHQQHGIALNGIVLISPVLDFNTIDFSPSNDLPYLLFLPSYAAAAWYHKKIPQHDEPLETFLKGVETWAVRDYCSILAHGRTLASDERQTAALQLHTFTSILPEYFLKSDLRCSSSRFCKELLRNQQRIIGRMDSRITMPDTDTAGEAASCDPSLERLVGAFAGAINHYVRSELQFQEDTPYKYLNYSVSKTWDWRTGIEHGQGYVSLSKTLADALHLHEHLRVFIAAGYYDLATPYFATRYTVNHLQLEGSRAGQVMLHCYYGGHMLYTDAASLQRLTQDAATFYRGGYADHP